MRNCSLEVMETGILEEKMEDEYQVQLIAEAKLSIPR
jgi:hypothetical protein